MAKTPQGWTRVPAGQPATPKGWERQPAAPSISKGLMFDPAATAPRAREELERKVQQPNRITPTEQAAFDRAGKVGVSKYQPFGQAFLAGLDDLGALASSAYEATGEITGWEGLAAAGRVGRTEFSRAGEEHGERGRFSDIGSVGDALSWASQTAGNMIPVMAPSVAGGALGAAAGTVGAVAGAFVPSLAMGVGEVQMNMKDKDPNARADGWVFAGGTAIAALDSVLPGKIGGKLISVLGRETAEEVALRALLRPAAKTALARVAKEAGKDAMIEGITESVQEAIGEVAASKAADQGIDWKGLPERMLESGAAGALMGGFAGGATGVAEARADRQASSPDQSVADAFEPTLTDSDRGSALPDGLILAGKKKIAALLGENPFRAPESPRVAALPEVEETTPAAPIAPRPAASEPIGKAARAAFMSRVGGVESGNSDTAKNPNSSASGRYQFTDGTWAALGGDPAKKNDRAEQERMMKKLTDQNESALKKAGIELTPGNYYLAHFAGAGGAVALHKNPSGTAEQILGADVVKANPFLAGMKGRDVIAWAARKMGGAPSSPAADPSPVPEAAGETETPTQPRESATDMLKRVLGEDILEPAAGQKVEVTRGGKTAMGLVEEAWADRGQPGVRIKLDDGTVVNEALDDLRDAGVRITQPVEAAGMSIEQARAETDPALDYDSTPRDERVRIMQAAGVDSTMLAGGPKRNSGTEFARLPEPVRAKIEAHLRKGYAQDSSSTLPAQQEDSSKTVAREPIKARTAKRFTGDDETTAVTVTGREVPVSYRVVELGDMIASNTPDGGVNPAYPSERQPRDRSRAASQSQIAEIAGSLNPRLLARSPKAADGSPIIDETGVVESGNGRTLALQQVYANGGAKADEYRAMIEAEGFDTSDMKQPVLVRVRGKMADEDVQAFIREANARDTAGMSGTETAASDAAALPGNLLGLYRGGDVDAAGNRDFVRGFVNALVPANERASLVLGDGSIASPLIKRIEAALLVRAVGQRPFIEKLVDAPDNNIKAIGKALVEVAPALAQLREAVAAGTVDASMDISDNIAEAVEIVDRARREGKSVADLINQTDIFTGEAVDPITEAVVRLFFNRAGFKQPAGQARIAESLSFFIEQAEKAAPGGGLFGEADKANPKDILALSRERTQGASDEAQPDLLASPSGDGTGVQSSSGDGARPAGKSELPQPGEQSSAAGQSELATPSRKDALKAKVATKRAATAYDNLDLPDGYTVKDGTSGVALYRPDGQMVGGYIAPPGGVLGPKVRSLVEGKARKDAARAPQLGPSPEDLAGAEEAGGAAFRIGRERRIPNGYPTQFATAWYRGWDRANLAAPVPEKAPTGPQRIGKNARGNDVFEDENGVRSYVENGIRLTEAVGIVPGRGITVDVAGRWDDYKTTEELAAAKPAAHEPAPVKEAPASTYGANNRLVSQDRAAELRARLKEKLKQAPSQLNSIGIDPEMLAIGSELAVFHIEAGARRFQDFAKAIATDLDMQVRDLRRYLRGWYNGARDTMEDSGESVAGMDTPDEVGRAMRTLEDWATEEAPAADIGEALDRWIKADPARARAEYEKIDGPISGSSDGGRIINTDLARELSPEYRADRSRSAEVHEAASAFTKRLYAEKLAEPVAEGFEQQVLFTAGGTGAGKSTGMKLVPESVTAGIIYDTNMNTLDSAVQKIEQALAAGWRVMILYTYRDPIEALEFGALPRAMRMGRTVPVEAHIETHAGSRTVVAELATRYANDPRVTVEAADNSHGKNNAALVPLELIPAVSDVGLYERAKQTVEAAFQAGRIDEATLRGTLGDRADGIRTASQGAVEARSPGDRGQPESPYGGARPLTENPDGNDSDGSPTVGTLDPAGSGQADRQGGEARLAAGAGRDSALAPRGAEADGGNGPQESDREAGFRAGREDAGRQGGEPARGDADGGRAGTGGAGLAGPRGRSRNSGGVSRPDFHIADPAKIIGGTPKVRFAKNRAAIEAYQRAVDESREPTKAEVEAIAAYTGWGSFGQELFQGSWERGLPKDAWKDEDAWLRDHLGEENWKSAQASIINAHYTDPPTVQAMWAMAEKLGFRGGRVLEPSMGIGNFFSLMPKRLRDKSDLTGIEMDKMTGGMAKMLFPNSTIHVMPYQDSRTPDGFYDLVIGNWPFAADGPADRRYLKLAPSLHDFFFLKALDQTRAGGLVMGVTSAGTMDKVGRATRIELAKKADLVAAFRLPSGAFEEYAGTMVVTDILVFQKREKALTDISKVEWIDTFKMEAGYNQAININEYWKSHPDAVLGTLGYGSGTTYGRPAMIVTRPDDLRARLDALPKKLKKVYREVERGNEPRFVTNNSADRHGSITIGEDGAPYQVQGERMVRLEDIAPRKLTPKDVAQVKALVGLRRGYAALIDAERDGDANVEDLRGALNKNYQAFRKAHGPIIEAPALRLFDKLKDPGHAVLAALEKPDGSPSRILSEPMVRAARQLDNPTVSEAFVVERNKGMLPDMEAIAAAAGVSVDEAVADLLAQKAIYRAPGGGYEVADVYLSGNVRQKLAAAKDALAQGEDMAASVEALEAVIPANIPYYQIEAKLGATWVPGESYEQFIAHLLNADAEKISAKYAGGKWLIELKDRSVERKSEANAIWGTERIAFGALLRHAFNNTSPRITRPDENRNLVLDEAASAAAAEKIALIREEFGAWAFRDPVRRVGLERAYNEVMNAIATPQYDGSFLQFPGMALEMYGGPLSLRKHQVDAIWQGLANGRGLFAHEVGTGKTLTIGGIAVEGRRFGIHRKPLILAHNANSGGVAAEINEMYPGAAVLYIDNLAPDNIKTTLRRIRNEDWDAIVMPHSVLDRIGLSRKTLEALAADEIALLEEEAIKAAEDDNTKPLTVDAMNDPEQMKKIRSVTAKNLVHQRNRIIANIDKQALRASKDGAVSFEELGIDAIIVDEAHVFKKPPIATRMQLKGLNTATSARSIALKFLTDYAKQQRNGQGTYLFTGTPITNTLTEIFNMQRYVMSDVMAKDGIEQWDAWFNTFADASSDVELNAAGEYEPVTRLASFVNVAELRRMAGQFLDIVFADDMPEFKPRETPSGKKLGDADLTAEERENLIGGRADNPIGRPYKKIINDVAPMGAHQQGVMELLVGRSRQFRAASKKERRELMLSGDPSSPVIVETDAANASLDVRLFEPGSPDEPSSKVNRAATNIVSIYREHEKATQVVFMERGFSDSSVRKGEKVKRLNLAKDLTAKLVAAGIPANQIAVVDGSTSKIKRKEIADKVKRAEIRVVIGSTSTLGTGVNMQDNMRAMHHLDAPWMPGELEQRNGRGWRQGNAWNTVLEYRYITEKLDGRRWQVLAVKERFIKAFLKADSSVRVIEGDAVEVSEKEDDIAATLADAAGDPRLMLRTKLKNDIEKLERRERAHTYGIADAIETADELVKTIAAQRTDLPLVEDDAAHAVALRDDKGFKAVVDGKTYTKRPEATEAIEKAVEKLMADLLIDRSGTPKIDVTVNGFKLLAKRNWASREPRFEIERRSTYPINRGSLGSIEANIRSIPQQVQELQDRIAQQEKSVEALRAAAKAPFGQAESLAKRKAMYAAIDADLQLNPVPAPQWLRSGAPVDTEVFVRSGEGLSPLVVEGHRWTPTDWTLATDQGEISYREALNADGEAIYEEREFVSPVVEKKDVASIAPESIAPAFLPGIREADVPAVQAELRARLDKMGLQSVRLDLTTREQLGRPGATNPPQGTYVSGRQIIRVALDAVNDRGFVLDHEAVHALRDAGAFSPLDWNILITAARKDTAIWPSIQQRYRNLSEEAQLEEAVADMFALYQEDQRVFGRFGRTVVRIIRNVLKALEALRSVLTGKGFATKRRPIDALADIASGRMAENIGRFETGNAVNKPAKNSLFDEPAQPQRTMTAQQRAELEARQKQGMARRGGQQGLGDQDGGLFSAERDQGSLFSIAEADEAQGDMVSLGGSEPTWRGKMAEGFDAWRRTLQDRYLPLLKVQREIEQATGQALPNHLNPYLGEELMTGRIGAQLEKLTDDMVGPLFDAMAEEKVTVDELETYLYARHAPERNARIREINPAFQGEGDSGSGMTDIQAAAIMARIEREGRMEVFNRLAERVDAIRDFAVDYRVESGLMSEEQRASWQETYQYYVPLRGFKEVEGDAASIDRINKSGRGINVAGKESKAAYGRRSMADSPLAYLILQAEEAVVRGETNRVAQRFVRLAEENANPDFWEVNKVQYKRRENPDTGLVEDYLVTQLTAEDRDWTVVAKFDGKQRRVTMNRQNPSAARLADAMRRLTEHQMDWVTLHLGKVNRFLSAVNTSYNPEFVITNAFRDIQTATANMVGLDVKGLTAGTLRDYRKALVASTKGEFGKGEGRWRELYDEFVEYGGKVSFNNIENIEQIKKRIENTMALARAKTGDTNARLQVKRSFMAAKDLIESLNGGVENAVRLSAYKNAREAGMSPENAASLAKNLTVNFNRRGTAGPALNAAYLFFNASVQGSVRLFQALRSRKVQKLMAGVVGFGVAVEFLNAMLSADDDDGESFYDKIPAFEKSRNLIFMLPNGREYIKIPLPYGYNAFFVAGQSAGEIARRGGDRWQESAGNLLTTIVDSFNPVGGSESLLNFLAPTLADPVVDLVLNRDFADRPIMPENPPYGSPEPDSQRYWPSVGPHWKAVTDFLSSATGGDGIQEGAIEVSPETLEHMAGVVVGAAGATIDRMAGLVGKAADPEKVVEVNDVIFARKLVGQKAGWYDKTAYYDRQATVALHLDNTKDYLKAENVEGARAYAKQHADILGLRGISKLADKQMRAVRKDRRAIEHSYEMERITAEQRLEAMTRLKEREDRVIGAFNTAWNKAMAD